MTPDTVRTLASLSSFCDSCSKLDYEKYAHGAPLSTTVYVLLTWFLHLVYSSVYRYVLVDSMFFGTQNRSIILYLLLYGNIKMSLGLMADSFNWMRGVLGVETNY